VTPESPAVIASLALAAAVFALALALIPRNLPEPPAAGEAGLERRRALRRHRWLPILEAVLAAVSVHVRRLPLGPLRARLARRLEQAGHPLGLGVDGVLSAAVLGGVLGGTVGGALLAAAVGTAAPGVVVGVLAGTAWPLLRVDNAAILRRQRVCRDLPQAIDLASLAMQAGLDLPGALAQVANRLSEERPLKAELQHFLRRLSLGRSRAEAMGEMARRVPAPEVRQFTSAVIQADRQGTPLAEVLGIQAGVMRRRRSQAAEQKAARAAILLMGPLMLIFACVFLVLLGPFAVKWARGQLF